VASGQNGSPDNMPTAKDLAQQYAARLKQVQSRLTKTASNRRETFKAEVVAVLRDADAYVESDAILSELDTALGIKTGTFSMLKKSSIQATLQFEQYVDWLLSTLDS
jgi:uncharacterized protein YPO0396